MREDRGESTRTWRRFQPSYRPQPQAPSGRPLSDASTGELLSHAVDQARELVMKEVELARSELRANVAAEKRTATGLGVAGLLGVAGFTLLFVALALLLATWMPGWLAGLIVAGFLLIVGGIAAAVSWARRVKTPMQRTQRSMRENVEWAKNTRI